MPRIRGTKPDPPELRLLKGNPQKRPMRAPVDTPKPDGVPPYPPTLKTQGKRAWNRYWQYGKVWLAYTDIPIMTELCELHDQAAAIRRILDKEGWFVVSEDTGRSYRHALAGTLNGIQSRMLTLWGETHMTPSSRGRANVHVPKDDELGKWMKDGAK